MKTPDASELQKLEDQIQESLRTLDVSGLRILGYGEVTTVFRLDTPEGSYACKRFPIFRTPGIAQSHQELIRDYIRRLGEKGVRVLDSGFVSLDAEGGRTVLYLIQPIVEAERIGPAYFRKLTTERAAERFVEILETLKGCVSDRLAPDGQLSNWIFLDEGLSYIDISTPFMRGPDGKELTQWAALTQTVLSGILYPLRPIFAKKIPETVDAYYSLRGQAVDFLGNLRKEDLGHLIEPFIPIANDTLKLEEPITLEGIRKHYNEDADFYALLMKLFRINRAFQRTVLRRVYPNFIPPEISRNKF